MEEFAAYVGWDWAEREHQVSLKEAGGGSVERRVVEGRPEAFHEWAAEMLERFGGGRIALGIDAGRGAVISALMHYPHIVIYPINPKAAKDLRNALYPSGKKDDPVDSEISLEYVEKHRDRLRPMNPADPLTRELGLLSEHRRKLAQDITRQTNRLRDVLKSYYPQVLCLFEELNTPMVCDFLLKWPTLQSLQRARESTITEFFRRHNSRSEKKIDERLTIIRSAVRLTEDEALVNAGAASVQALVTVIRALVASVKQLDKRIASLYTQHAEYDLVNSFPGLGEVLGPRMVALLTSDRDRFDSAEAIQQFTGVAPITERTGGKNGPISVQRRVRRSKFHHQTMVEWAHWSLTVSAWARAYCEWKKEQHPKIRHYVLMRSLAYKWVRILFRCWKNGTNYDENLYQQELARRGSPIAQRLAMTAA